MNCRDIKSYRWPSFSPNYFSWKLFGTKGVQSSDVFLKPKNCIPDFVGKLANFSENQQKTGPHYLKMMYVRHLCTSNISFTWDRKNCGPKVVLHESFSYVI